MPPLHLFRDDWDQYRTGIITITSFALAALYSARKRNLWSSVHWLRLATRLPRKIARALIVLDRLETWRTVQAIADHIGRVERGQIIRVIR
jgi:hypothetical protein